MIHSQPEISAEISNLNPRPKLVKYRFIIFNKKCAFVRRSDAKRNHKRHDKRNPNRRAGNRAAKKFAVRPFAKQPIDNRTKQRRENY